MFRGRDKLELTLLALALTPCLLVGCIFSPQEKRIDDDDPAPTVIEKPEDLIATLEVAYRKRDVELFQSLLANDAENKAEYLFFLVEPTDQGETQWGYTEEVRIHQRMFRPENLPPGEEEVDPNLWLQSINIALTQGTPFEERSDLYSSSSNPDGLDRAKWRASDSRYGTFVFFDTVSDTDFLVEGEANFVVIEDLEKEIGDPGKFLIYRWEDLGGENKPALLVPTPS